MRPVISFLALLLLLCGGVVTITHAADAHRDLAAQFVFPDLAKASADALLDALTDKRIGYRSAAVQEIGNRKMSSAAEAIRPLLKDEVAFIRVDAAEALLALGDKSGVQTLRDVVKDPSATPSTALRAAHLLSKEGDESGQALALSKLSSPYFTNRVVALYTLRNSKHQEIAYSAMRIGLADSNREVRGAAVFNLGELGTPQSLVMLEPALLTKDPLEHSAVARAIGATRLWAAVPLLIDALGDTESVVRSTAAFELNALAGQKFNTDLCWKADKAPQLQQQWREWWDANKANYPEGAKSTAPKPVYRRH